MSERDALLMEMLAARRAKAEADGSTWLFHGLQEAVAVVEEWRGMFATPKPTPREVMPLGDAACDEGEVTP